MAPMNLLFGSVILLASVVAGTPDIESGTPLISAYYPAYTPNATVNWKYTDIAMYFVLVTTKDGFMRPADQTEEGLRQFVATAYDQGTLPMVSIGGWTGSVHFSSLVKTVESRNQLALQIREFLYTNALKGVELDWLYPGAPGIGCNEVSEQDSKNFLLFLKHLRGMLGLGWKISFTAAPECLSAGASGSFVEDYSEYAKYVNWVNLLTYEYKGGKAWANKTGPGSPLHACASGGGIVTAVKTWTDRGFPANKIFISFGHSFITTSSELEVIHTLDNDGGEHEYKSYLYQNFTSIPEGQPGDSDAVRTDICNVTISGIWNYNALISQGLLSEDGAKALKDYARYFDACTSTAFLFNSKTRHLIAYEDATSASIKSVWARERGIKGVAVGFSDGLDDNVYASIAKGLGLAVTEDAKTMKQQVFG